MQECAARIVCPSLDTSLPSTEWKRFVSVRSAVCSKQEEMRCLLGTIFRGRLNHIWCLREDGVRGTQNELQCAVFPPGLHIQEVGGDLICFSQYASLFFHKGCAALGCVCVCVHFLFSDLLELLSFITMTLLAGLVSRGLVLGLFEWLSTTG